MKYLLVLSLIVAASIHTAPIQAQQSSQPLPGCGLKNVSFQVELLSPLGTSTAKPGDAFTTTVRSPEPFRGGSIEGVVKTLVKAERGFGKGKPKIELEFNSLTYNNRHCSIIGEVKDVTNSKGVAKVDDEGRLVGHTSNKKRIGATVGGAMLGAVIGAAAGGGPGAIAGAAAGGAAGFTLSSTMTATGTDIQFLPGAVFTLQVSDAKVAIQPR